MKGRRISAIELKYEKLRLERVKIEKQLNDPRVIGEKRRRRLKRHLVNVSKKMNRLYSGVSGPESKNIPGSCLVH